MTNENSESHANQVALREVYLQLSKDSWKPWKLSITEVADKLSVDPSIGLSQHEVQLRLKLFGENLQINLKPRLRWYQFFLHVCTDPVVILLLAVGVLYLLWSEGIEAVSAVMVIVLALGLELGLQWKGNVTANSLSTEIPENVLVVRDNHEHIVVSRDLVPGDIVIISQGQRIPADGVLINCQNLSLDESLFTGEHKEVRKYSLNEVIEIESNIVPSGYLCSGSCVTKGKGVLLVTATGKHTRLAIVQRSSSCENRKTPLQTLTKSLTTCLSVLALVISIILLVVSIVKGVHWHDVLLIVMGLAYVMIPSELPSLVNTILIASSKRLSQKRFLLRRLEAAEALGSVSAIVTDKTGTLTCNALRVSSAIVLTRPDRQSNESFQINCRRITPGSSQDTLQYLLPLTITWALSMDQFACDNLFQLVHEGDQATPISSSPLPLATGIDKDVFDSAIFDFLSSSKIPSEMQRYLIQSALLVFSKFPVPISEVPFDISNRISFRTRGSTLNKNSGSRITVVRGAPESILSLCNRIWVSGYEECPKNHENQSPQIDTDVLNDVEHLTGYVTSKLTESLNEVARKGRRVFAYAYSTSSHNEGKELPKDFIFVGAYVFIDPIRLEIPFAVSECQDAGIQVIMATGDYPETALAIASKVGISKANANKCAPVLLGKDIDKISSVSLLAEAVENTDVFARVSPDNKVRIVKALQTQGHVVAFIGDGINDASALRTADVGITIGGASTTADTASDHASLVVLGHHFDAVVYCLREGRRMLENIGKVVTFYLACKLALTSLFVFVYVIWTNFPLDPVQIILLEIFVNLGASITFIVERAERSIMEIPPIPTKRHRARSGRLSSGIGLLIVFYAALLLLSTGSSYFYGALYGADQPSAATMLFVSWLINHFTLGLVVRSHRTPLRKQGLFTNINILIWFVIVMACIMVYLFVPGFRSALGLSTLNQTEWTVILIGTFILLVMSEVCKELRWQYSKCEKAWQMSNQSSERAPLLSN